MPFGVWWGGGGGGGGEWNEKAFYFSVIEALRCIRLVLELNSVTEKVKGIVM